MTDPLQSEDVNIYNKRKLEKLAWAISTSQGQFKLILARCNYASLRSQMVEHLQKLCSVEIRTLRLKESNKTLYATIRAELGQEHPAVLMVLGLESVYDLDQVLTSTNQVREEFRKNFHFPLVLWVNDEVLKKLVQLAPDFESWATTTEFVIATNTLVNQLKQYADQWFDNQLKLTLEGSLQLEAELQAAQRDLLSHKQSLDLKSKANLESLLGFVKEINNQVDAALEHYQRSLVFWQKSYNLERQGKLLKNITFCYYLKAFRNRETNHSDRQVIRDYLQQCLKVFEQANRPDLVADSIPVLGRVLGFLQDWEQLQSLAKKALQQHKTKGKPIELAQDYGFLAEAALAQKRWTNAEELAQKALKALPAISSLQLPSRSDSYYLSDKTLLLYDATLYQFILARSQQQLGQTQEALKNLEMARKIGVPSYSPKLYLEILSHLQKLYFEKKEYPKAFEIKQERQSIEQQYGFRAFIGAGRLQPQKQAELVGTQHITPSQMEIQGTLSPEITASGRQQNVKDLIEKLARNDYKLIVLYGQSGVGKSSLVSAGLMPDLKRKAIGTRDNLPVLLQNYTNWAEELKRRLAEALEERGIVGDGGSSKLEAPTSDPEISGLPPKATLPEAEATSPELKNLHSELETPHSELEMPSPMLSAQHSALEKDLIEQLRQNEQRNLRTVLIFDQFEEFFFGCPDPAKRRLFFEFLGKCLAIVNVKVVFSLREDYLHYLLECNRPSGKGSIKIDVLSENILYEIGNFSPADAKSIIQRLTEHSNFHLESSLVDALVRDLASELGEVRPIELQVVGAQLQTDNITKLDRYQRLGQEEALVKYQKLGRKEELVRRYLEEVVKDCGPENKQVAELVLYLLTNEKGTRPLKTRDELERDLKASPVGSTVETSKLDLVLKIFVKSNIVFQLPEVPADRYQLVHDYLATLIRQQQELKKDSLTEKLKKFEAKLNWVTKIAIIFGIAACFGAVGAGVFGLQARKSEIQALSSESKARFLSGDQFGALVAGVKAAQKLQNKLILTPGKEDEDQVRNSLLQVVYDVQEFNRLENHTNWVYDVSFSPDGQTIATASADKTVKLWNRDGTYRRTLDDDPNDKNEESHDDWVYSVSFSPNGQTIATASADKTVKLWNRDGTYRRTLKRHTDRVLSVSFSPDSQTIATASWDKTVKLWNWNGNYRTTLVNNSTDKVSHSARVNSVSFSLDGRTIATADDDNNIKLWTTWKGTYLNTLSDHTDKVYSVKFSRDKKTIATASWDKTVKLWKTQDGTWHDGKVHKTLDESLGGHTDRVFDVSFSPDSQIIATASWDKTVKLWNQDGNLLRTLKGHTDRVLSVGFSPNGQTISSASSDKTVKFWRRDNNLLPILYGHGDVVRSVSFSPDGQSIATAGDDKMVKLWNQDGTPYRNRHGTRHKPLKYKDAIFSVRFSPDSKTTATASADKTVKLWNQDGNLLNTLDDPNDKDNPNDKADNVSHSDEVFGVSFSSNPDPKHQIIATASADKTVKLWNQDGNLLNTLDDPNDKDNPNDKADNVSHSDRVVGLEFSPNPDPKHQIIATASDDGTAKLWNQDGTYRTTLDDPNDKDNPNDKADNVSHSDEVNGVSFSPNPDPKHQIIATASDDKTIKLWDREGALLTTIESRDKRPEGHDERVLSVEFSRDGKTLASASFDKTIKLWKLEGPPSKLKVTLLQTLQGHDDWVWDMSFSPDGKQLASASEDKTVRLWNVSSIESQTLSLDQLLKKGCNWLLDYLKTNPNEKSDRRLCDGVGTQK